MVQLHTEKYHAVHLFLNRSKLEAKRLETQWKRICDHEKRSMERNKELLKDYDRVEQHAALLAVKTERLKAYKVHVITDLYCGFHSKYICFGGFRYFRVRFASISAIRNSCDCNIDRTVCMLLAILASGLIQTINTTFPSFHVTVEFEATI